MRTRNQEKREEEESAKSAEKKSGGDVETTKSPTRKRKSLAEAEAAPEITPEAAARPASTKKAKSGTARKSKTPATEPTSAGAGEEGVEDGASPAAAAAQNEAVDSEDEAPEEISLSSGKVAAQKQADDEKRERDARPKSAKKKRRKSSADGGSGAGEVLDAEAQEALDELPPEIIAALQKQAKEEALKAAQAKSHKNSTALEVGAQLVEGEELPYRQAGPVTVRILDDTSKPSFNPSESARDYAQQRLYGARLKRSTAMLQPVRGSRIKI